MTDDTSGGDTAESEQRVYSVDEALAIATGLHQQGRLREAEGFYQKLIDAAPDHPGVLQYFGILRLQQGAGDEAVALLERALVQQPNDPDLHNNYGNVLRQMERWQDALAAYQKAVTLAPQHADGHNNLGLIYRRLGQLDDALAAGQRACELLPERPDFRFNLGNILFATKDYDAAAEHYRAAVDANPEWSDAMNRLGHALRLSERHEEAAETYQRALAASADQAETQLYLGHSLLEQKLVDDAIDAYRKAISLKPDLDLAYLSLGMLLNGIERTDEAEQVWRAWLAAVPDQPTALHMLAAASGEQVLERAGDAYVQELFDNFAPDFDRKLAKLDYRAPQLLADQLAARRQPNADLHILDAGCGTGLCGPLLRPYAAQLSGVDLSPGMLQLAAERGGFDELAEAELTEYINAHKNAFDVIVVADTLVYFGDLSDALTAVAGALRADGLLLVSLEVGNDDDGYTLNAHGRYSHGRGYIERRLTEAGLKLHALEQAVLRLEQERPVNGWLLVAGR